MKKPIIIINTFNAINFPQDKKPIVICDIDLTFIRPIRNYSNLYNQLKNKYSDPKELERIVNDMLHMSINIGLVKQTDCEGFQNMLERINQLGGKFLFLTARSSLSHEKTINDLKKAGLQNPENFEIHYTGNEITKGFYILKHHLLYGYNHHIFIDDYPHFLESALQIYPDMNCYLFKYK
jgi:predicted secreted acid phosphatase